MERLFIGVFPPPEAAKRIAALAADLRMLLGLSGRPQAAERAHATLFFLGDHETFPEALVDAVHRAADGLDFAPFEVVFDRAQSFTSRPKNLPFVLRGGEALVGLRQALGARLVEAGLAREGSSAFTPHVTLLYNDKAVGEMAVDPVAWTVDGFVLVRSRRGEHRYDHLQTWPLKA